MWKLKIIGVLAVFAVAACSGAENSKRVLGTLSFYDDPADITLPASVARGETFTITLTTYGGGCLEQGDTDTEVTGLEAEVTPYDLDTSRPEYPCTADLVLYSHLAELRFDESGEAQIRITGLQKDAENSEGTVIQLTRTLTVR